MGSKLIGRSPLYTCKADVKQKTDLTLTLLATTTYWRKNGHTNMCADMSVIATAILLPPQNILLAFLSLPALLSIRSLSTTVAAVLALSII